MHFEEQSESEGLRKPLALWILIIPFPRLWTGEFKHLTGCRSHFHLHQPQDAGIHREPHILLRKSRVLCRTRPAVSDRGTKLTCEKQPSLVQTRIPRDTSACEQKNCHLGRKLGFKGMSGGCCRFVTLGEGTLVSLTPRAATGPASPPA